MLKALNWYLVIASCIGFVLLTKKKAKVAYIILSIIVFSTTWRIFSRIQSSRYYAILILLGLFLNNYTSRLFFHNRSDNLRKAINFFVLSLAIIIIQMYEVFHSFNNVFYLDICDITKNTLYEDTKTKALIYSKDYERIKRNLHIPSQLQNAVKTLDEYKIESELCDNLARNLSFTNNTLFIVPNINGSRSNERTIQSFKPFFLETNRFVSNSSHSRSLSIFKGFKYDPQTTNPINTFLKSPGFLTITGNSVIPSPITELDEESFSITGTRSSIFS